MPGRRPTGGGGGGRVARFFAMTFTVLATLAVWVVIAGFFSLFYFAKDLPVLTNPPKVAGARAVEIRAQDNTLIASYGENYGEWLKSGEIPQKLVHALVATEDRRFFDHLGFDPIGLARATVTNVKAGRTVQGGSTITQQLAKNMVLTTDRTFKRKIQELLLALELEQRFSKDEILELYLNQVYFGAGTYGLDSAARAYFGHSARRLTYQEAAILVGLLKAPTSYAPTRNLEKSWDRAKIVLDAMAREGYLTTEKAEFIKNNPPPLKIKAIGGNNRWFADWVRDRALAIAPAGRTPIIVRTTLDLRAQTSLDAAISSTLAGEGAKLNARQGAGLIMSVDGAIRAMIGGSSYAETQYNRTLQARRQPGSAFKPFIYLAAIEAGLTPDAVYVDEPMEVDGWAPRNYTRDNLGPMTLRDAFRKSINTVAVKVSEEIGRERVAGMARRLGIRDEIQLLPSLALGTFETSLLDLTRAYGALASGGYMVEPYAILEIRTPDGVLLYRAPSSRYERVLDRTTVATMTNMMEGVLEPGGTGTAARIGRPAAGKTGTTQDSRDAWFVGFTADYVGGIWFGNDDNKPMQKVVGGGIPARTWSAAMKSVHTGLPVRPLLTIEAAAPDLIPGEDGANEALPDLEQLPQ